MFCTDGFAVLPEGRLCSRTFCNALLARARLDHPKIEASECAADLCSMDRGLATRMCVEPAAEQVQWCDV